LVITLFSLVYFSLNDSKLVLQITIIILYAT
jgi:hypothetical protein